MFRRNLGNSHTPEGVPISSGMTMRVLLDSSRTLITSPQWLRQQIWSLSTEIVLSLLAAIGLIRGIHPGKVALGLALSYGLAGVSSLPLARGGKGRVAIVGIVTVAFSFAAATQHGRAGWWWLACAVGGLMAFRDSASLTATAWSPWQAMRCRTSPLSMSAIAQSLAIFVAAIATFLSSFIQNAWPAWSGFVVLIALCLGIPDAFFQRFRKSSVRNPIRAFFQSWRLPQIGNPAARPVIITAILFSAAHLMGRRLLLPVLLIALISRAGWGAQSLVLVGASMGIISIVTLVLRLVLPAKGSHDPKLWFNEGIRSNILAWSALITLGFVHQYLHTYIALGWMLIAWIMMEVSGRRWSVGYVDSLRMFSHEVDVRRNRSHREILSVDILARNSAASAGLVLGGLSIIALPAVMACLLMVCAFRLDWRRQ